MTKLPPLQNVFSEKRKTYNQTISSSEKENWLHAMQEGFKSSSDTNTWNSVEGLKDNNVIP